MFQQLVQVVTTFICHPVCTSVWQQNSGSYYCTYIRHPEEEEEERKEGSATEKPTLRPGQHFLFSFRASCPPLPLRPPHPASSMGVFNRAHFDGDGDRGKMKDAQ